MEDKFNPLFCPILILLYNFVMICLTVTNTYLIKIYIYYQISTLYTLYTCLYIYLNGVSMSLSYTPILLSMKTELIKFR
jgi:hypothetical protein